MLDHRSAAMPAAPPAQHPHDGFLFSLRLAYGVCCVGLASVHEGTA
jgi:hypothetical protein